MRQSLPNSAPSPAAPDEAPSATRPTRGGACWYALMHQRADRDADEQRAPRPRARAVHWSRTTQEMT
jgi:hypothetical protein